MPRVAEVFATGAVSYRLVKSVVKRTRLVKDDDARAKVDVEIAAQITGWGPLSVAKQEAEIDYWVDRFDPSAVVRSEGSARARHVDVETATDGSGMSYIEAVVYAHDGEALDRRLDEMAYGVCRRDPRTLDQRRSEALGALGNKVDRLQCLCGTEDCAAAQRTRTSTVVHVIAEEATLTDQTPVTLNGENPSQAEAPRGRHLLEPAPATGPALTNPAVILGGALIPAPIIAATLAHTATIRWLVHPGESPPEPRYTPSAKLSDFVRCRDMTCRFPGCDVEAYRCDLDHTIAYPVGPTQPRIWLVCAVNITCSRLSGVGVMSSPRMAPWCGRRRAASSSPRIRVAGCCSRRCAGPLRWSTSRPVIGRRCGMSRRGWACRDASRTANRLASGALTSSDAPTKRYWSRATTNRRSDWCVTNAPPSRPRRRGVRNHHREGGVRCRRGWSWPTARRRRRIRCSPAAVRRRR